MGRTLIFLGGAALGYVLGARAGQERYEELRQRSQRLLENPSVQETAGVVQARVDTARKRLGTVMDDKLGDRVPQQVRNVVQGSNGEEERTSQT